MRPPPNGVVFYFEVLLGGKNDVEQESNIGNGHTARDARIPFIPIYCAIPVVGFLPSYYPIRTIVPDRFLLHT